VRFEEVSLGYPDEVDANPRRPRALRQIFPPAATGQAAGDTTTVIPNP
jgi:hypothetical protein